MPDEIPIELHELNIVRGKLTYIMENWGEMSEQERAKELKRCKSLLEYPVQKVGDSDG